MFLVVTIAYCVVSMVASDLTKPVNMYSTKFDSIDIDQILKNDRLVTYFYKCLMGTGKCSQDGEEAKREYFYIYFIFIFVLLPYLI